MNVKICLRCKQSKPISDFYKHSRRKDGLQAICRECSRQVINTQHRTNPERYRLEAKEYYEMNKDKLQEKGRKKYYHNKQKRRQQRDKIKEEVLSHYGNGQLACVKCNFRDIRALSLDHIRGDGNEEKRRLHKVGIDLYIYLKKNGYPEGYQTLCMNCQFIKRVERGEYNQWKPKKLI